MTKKLIRPIKCNLCYREATHPLCERHYQQYLVDNFTKISAAKNDWISDQFIEILNVLHDLVSRVGKMEDTVNKKINRGKILNTD